MTRDELVERYQFEPGCGRIGVDVDALLATQRAACALELDHLAGTFNPEGVAYAAMCELAASWRDDPTIRAGAAPPGQPDTHCPACGSDPCQTPSICAEQGGEIDSPPDDSLTDALVEDIIELAGKDLRAEMAGTDYDAIVARVAAVIKRAVAEHRAGTPSEENR